VTDPLDDVPDGEVPPAADGAGDVPVGGAAAATTSVTAEAPHVDALDVDGVTAVAVGTAAWGVALVLCLVLRDRLADAGHGWWAWVCFAGMAFGLAGLVFVRRRRDAYARAHAS
jgi:hypothetical protein